MEIGGLLLGLGVLSIFVGALFGRHATRKHFGEVSEQTLDAAQMLGLTPTMAILRGIGWILALVGIGLLVWG